MTPGKVHIHICATNGAFLDSKGLWTFHASDARDFESPEAAWDYIRQENLRGVLLLIRNGGAPDVRIAVP